MQKNIYNQHVLNKRKGTITKWGQLAVIWKIIGYKLNQVLLVTLRTMSFSHLLVRFFFLPIFCCTNITRNGSKNKSETPLPLEWSCCVTIDVPVSFPYSHMLHKIATPPLLHSPSRSPQQQLLLLFLSLSLSPPSIKHRTVESHARWCK